MLMVMQEAHKYEYNIQVRQAHDALVLYTSQPFIFDIWMSHVTHAHASGEGGSRGKEAATIGSCFSSSTSGQEEGGPGSSCGKSNVLFLDFLA